MDEDQKIPHHAWNENGQREGLAFHVEPESSSVPHIAHQGAGTPNVGHEEELKRAKPCISHVDTIRRYDNHSDFRNNNSKVLHSVERKDGVTSPLGHFD